MSDAWKVFSKSELQDFVGQETLDRLHSILPALLGVEWDPDEILYKDNLVRIFEAFAGADSLRSRRFRETLFSHLSLDLLRELSGSSKGEDGNGDADHSQLSRTLARKPWTDGPFASSVVKRLELPEFLVPPETEAAPDVRKVRAPETPLKVLKDYQFGVFARAQSRLRTPNSRFIVQMPTGSGKTRTAMELVVSWLNQTQEPGLIFWLAHSVELCEQARAAFEEVWTHLGFFDVSVYSVWGNHDQLPTDPSKPALVIAGFPKVHSMLQGRRLPPEVSERTQLMVIDEAHKVLAPTYRNTVDALRGPNTRIIGLTATPGRSAVDEEQNERLAQFFFQELVTIDAGGDSVIAHLRRRGVLSEVVRERLETHRTYELSAADRQHLSRFYDVPAAFLARLGADDLRNVEIIRRLRHHAEEGRRVLLFACSVEQSKFLCALLTFLGVRAAHLDGGTSGPYRRHIIEQFRAGDIQVLSNFGVLATGFDAPKTDVVFVARPTASIVLYSQIIGRGLRGPAIGGTETCRVVDVIDNIKGLPEQEQLYEYFDDYFTAHN